MSKTLSKIALAIYILSAAGMLIPLLFAMTRATQIPEWSLTLGLGLFALGSLFSDLSADAAANVSASSHRVASNQALDRKSRFLSYALQLGAAAFLALPALSALLFQTPINYWFWFAGAICMLAALPFKFKRDSKATTHQPAQSALRTEL